ncbi:MAG: tetratricopeptide repeat protein [Cyanobacteria bacterium P01_G01_bin.38]
MFFKTLSALSIASLVALSPSVAIARALTCQFAETSENISPTFAPPTYRYQPLPQTLNTADAWQAVGMNAFLVRDYDNALFAFNKAVDLSGVQSPEILAQRGWLHYMMGNETFAIADLRTAAALYLDNQLYDRYVSTRNLVAFVDNQPILDEQIGLVLGQ